MKKRFLSLIIALAMMVGVFTPLIASADDETTLEQTTKSVTVHKLIPNNTAEKTYTAEDIKKQIEELTGDKKYVGQKLELATDVNKAKEIKDVYFVWTNDKDQVIDANGATIKKDKKEITITKNKLPEGIKESDLTGALAGLTGSNGKEFDTSKLKAGTYKIYEIHSLSKYVGKDGETLTKMLAVPVEITLPLNDVKEAHVYPKNVEDKPQIDKNFASNNGLGTVEDKNKNQNVGAKYENYDKEKATAKAEIGKKIPYEVKTQIPAEAKYKKLVWTDQMTKGLTYNKDLEVKLGNTVLTKYQPKEKTGDYKVISTDRGFTLKLTESGLAKVEETAKTAATEITLTYSATVNANAIPGKEDANDIKFDYGNKPGNESEPKEGQPENGEIKVEKSWAVDGKEVTEADKNVKALFTLQEKQTDGTWKDVDSYEATVAEKFKHTFTGLDNNKTYRVVEQVSGYEAEYVSFENGTAVIKNNKDTNNPKPLDPTEPKVVTGGKRFVKADQTDGTRLAGAEFKVKKTVGQEVKFLKEKDKKDIQKAIADYKAADKAYKDAVANLTQKDGVITYPEGVTADSIKTLKETRDQKFEAAQVTYEWGTEKEASVFKSNSKGQVEVIGLEYGDYTLVETKAPAGYGTPTNNETPFTVGATSYTTTENGVKYEPEKGQEDNTTVNETTGEAVRINNKKVSIPQTGGIGTVIFTAIGLAIMASAIIAIKKRQATEAR